MVGPTFSNEQRQSYSVHIPCDSIGNQTQTLKDKELNRKEKQEQKPQQSGTLTGMFSGTLVASPLRLVSLNSFRIP